MLYYALSCVLNATGISTLENLLRHTATGVEREIRLGATINLRNIAPLNGCHGSHRRPISSRQSFPSRYFHK